VVKVKKLNFLVGAEIEEIGDLGNSEYLLAEFWDKALQWNKPHACVHTRASS
jgi:hypothetical protein